MPSPASWRVRAELRRALNSWTSLATTKTKPQCSRATLLRRIRSQTITAGDIGKTLTFSFDAKLGNLADSSTASAFIKTIDGTGNLTNFVPFDTTGIPSEWNTYSISLDLTDALLEGQALQYGFSATATNNEPSGVVYDNVKAATTGP